MTWHISKGLFKSTLHGNTPAMGLSIYHKNGKYAIVDDSRKTVFSIFPISDTIVHIVDPSGTISVAEIKLEKSHLLTRPPRAGALALQMNGISCSILQNPDRSFSILFQNIEVGRISNMLGVKPTLVLPDTLGATHAALLYVLSLILLHQDDVEIV